MNRYAIVAAFQTVAVCTVLWLALRQSPSIPSQSELQFVRIAGDSNFPRSVRVFVGLPPGRSDDNAYILVASEPMMFGAKFQIDVGRGPLSVKLNDHTTAGTAQMYKISLPGVRAACVGSTNPLIGLRDAVAVSDFVGLLK